MRAMTTEEAKERLTIFDLWRHFELAGKPGKSPFREDHNASFSVSEDKRLWNDFTTGKGGDPMDFLQEANYAPQPATKEGAQ